MIKVRFNLSKGKNYMKWKIWSKTGTEYHSPDKVQLIMKNCTLKNNRKTAEKILAGEHKEVCAWIVCESISFKHKGIDNFAVPNKVEPITYNPRVKPHWVYDSLDADGKSFSTIVSFNNKLFTTKN